MLCTCKARTEDDCVCTRLCACGERFEIFEPNDRYCDYCYDIHSEPGITLDMIGLVSKDGHLYLNF